MEKNDRKCGRGRKKKILETVERIELELVE